MGFRQEVFNIAGAGQGKRPLMPFSPFRRWMTSRHQLAVV
jgi:hypothetical protein